MREDFIPECVDESFDPCDESFDDASFGGDPVEEEPPGDPAGGDAVGGDPVEEGPGPSVGDDPFEESDPAEGVFSSTTESNVSPV